jgi:hypothetical protein
MTEETRQLIPFASTALHTLRFRTTSKHFESADGIAYRGLAANASLCMAANGGLFYKAQTKRHGILWFAHHC